MRYFLIGFLLFTSPSHADVEETVSNAFLLCATFDATGLLSEPCKVRGGKRSIDVRIDTTASEARKICSGIASFAKDKRLEFMGGWSVRVFSPYSGSQSIAYCSLSS